MLHLQKKKVIKNLVSFEIINIICIFAIEMRFVACREIFSYDISVCYRSIHIRT